MIKSVASNIIQNVNCKKSFAKNVNKPKFDLPVAKNLEQLPYDKLDKKGPFCGIDQSAI